MSSSSSGGSQRVRFCDPLMTLEIAGQRALCASGLSDSIVVFIKKVIEFTSFLLRMCFQELLVLSFSFLQ